MEQGEGGKDYNWCNLPIIYAKQVVSESSFTNYLKKTRHIYIYKYYYNIYIYLQANNKVNI